MTFDHPVFLCFFLVFIPLILFDIFGRKKKYKLPEALEKKLTSSKIFFRLFLVFAIIALAGPRWGMGFAPREYRRGLDAVFAIDISRSMDIRDAQTRDSQQSRLERGLAVAYQSAASISGARIAAAIGRGKGYLAVPLTYDNEAVLHFLESLDSFSITGRSTNLESLLEAASGAFLNTSPARKVIVLISDGESHTGVIRNALNRCIREGIIVNTVAVGSDEGREVPLQANDQQSPAPISRRDSAVMRIAAERTGGIYIDGGREDAASALSAHLLSLAQETGAGSSRSEQKQRRTLFIILAIISYGASKFVPLMPSLPVVSMLVSVFFLSSCSEGKLLLLEANYLISRGRYDEAIVSYHKALSHDDAAPYAEYGLGLTFHSLDEATAALKRYGNSQKILESFSGNEHRELRYRNHYNSGIIFFEEGNFRSAAAAFREALRSDPAKIEAKRNLELSLLSISMETNEESHPESQQEQREILFQYIKQEEEQQWRSREWTPEEESQGPDY
jgi:Ca-activated chloride channel family protein